MAASVRAVWGGADAVRGSEHVKSERGLSGGGNGADEDVQVVGSSLLQCPQEGRGDEYRDWEQVVFGLAVAGDDAQIFGGESRTVRGVGLCSKCWGAISDANSKSLGERPRQRRVLARTAKGWKAAGAGQPSSLRRKRQD